MPDHPIMPAGYNADPIDGDEVDGSGTNWAIWPVLFDCYIGLIPMLLTDEMLEAFVQQCPDLILFPEDDTVMFQRDRLVVTARPDIEEIAASGEIDSITMSRETGTVIVQPEGDDVTTTGESDELGLPDEPDTTEIRKAG
jgi:hypothetical protein